MKKIKILSLLLALLMCTSVLFISCEKEEEGFKVTYVPVDEKFTFAITVPPDIDLISQLDGTPEYHFPSL